LDSSYTFESSKFCVTCKHYQFKEIKNKNGSSKEDLPGWVSPYIMHLPPPFWAPPPLWAITVPASPTWELSLPHSEPPASHWENFSTQRQKGGSASSPHVECNSRIFADPPQNTSAQCSLATRENEFQIFLHFFSNNYKQPRAQVISVPFVGGFNLNLLEDIRCTEGIHYHNSKWAYIVHW
jgi:hypothetical protein